MKTGRLMLAAAMVVLLPGIASASGEVVVSTPTTPPEAEAAAASEMETPTPPAAEAVEAAASTEAEEESAEVIEPADTEPRVAHARFTSGIADREPVDSVTFLQNDTDKIFFFTDLRNLKGQTVTHRWEREGEILATVPFEVRGDRWRVWSSKSLRPEWLGEWRVSVVDGNDVVIGTRTFTYSESGKPADLTP